MAFVQSEDTIFYRVSFGVVRHKTFWLPHTFYKVALECLGWTHICGFCCGWNNIYVSWCFTPSQPLQLYQGDWLEWRQNCLWSGFCCVQNEDTVVYGVDFIMFGMKTQLFMEWILLCSQWRHSCLWSGFCCVQNEDTVVYGVDFIVFGMKTQLFMELILLCSQWRHSCLWSGFCCVQNEDPTIDSIGSGGQGETATVGGTFVYAIVSNTRENVTLTSSYFILLIKSGVMYFKLWSCPSLLLLLSFDLLLNAPGLR